MLHKAPSWLRTPPLCLWLQEIKMLQLRQRGRAQKFFCASVCYLPITPANLPVKPGDPNIPPTAVCDPLDVGNLQAKGSGKADHRMQLHMCCTATHRGVSSGSPHLGEVNMPTPCFSPQSESAPTRNDYIFECHMRQWPLSHAEIKPSCEIFAGRQRKTTNIYELNV